MSFMVKDVAEQTNLGVEAVETGKWMWCQVCHRCYHYGEYRTVKGIQLCPYDGCMGVIFVNSWPWSRVQKMYADTYPEIPERNVVYPGSVT